MDEALAAKLEAIGLTSTDFGEPGEAWLRLHRRFGRRATLVDRYELEAAARGVTVEGLDDELRGQLTREVLKAHWPGFEIVPGSDRASADPIEVVDYDPRWPERFHSWRERLARELGPAAQLIEHVGSTAVPGLPAKPVIDVQVSVPDLDDEASYVAPIERVGVALRSRDAEHRYFRPAGQRARDGQVHVCAAGSAWEREHVLFRDYLRANADAAAAYGRLKRRLAERYRADRIAYNEAKTGFILDHMELAERWAADTGWSVPDRTLA